MRVYKLMRLRKDNTLGSLFINRNEVYPIDKWLEANFYPTKGFAEREGWHCCFEMNAPHLKEKLANGEQRVWVECEIKDWEKYDRPESQGGAWILAKWMKIVKVIENNNIN